MANLNPIDMNPIGPYPEPENADGLSPLTEQLDRILGKISCRFSRFVYYGWEVGKETGTH